MEYITLNNGVKMPMAGLGTFLLSPDEAQESVYAALKEGYQLIDTANAYVNEEEVGEAKLPTTSSTGGLILALKRADCIHA